MNDSMTMERPLVGAQVVSGSSREVDARALEADLRHGIQGEVRFDQGSRALYATDGSNYRQVPIGVVVPKVLQDVVETVAAAHRHGAPVLVARLRHQPCRTVLQRRRRNGLFQVPQPRVGSRQDGRARRRPARMCAGQFSRSRLSAGPDVRTRSGDTLALHAGRNAGEQFVRNALLAGGQVRPGPADLG